MWPPNTRGAVPLSPSRMRTARPGEINYYAFDRFTFGHAAIGAGLGRVGAPFWATALFAVGWEIAERPLRVRGVLQMRAPDSYLGQDTAENALWDAMSMMGGWWLGNQWRMGK